MKRFYRLCFYPSASSSFSSSSASSSLSAISAYDRIQGVETLPNCRVFSYDELRVATNGFHPSNKSGEGRFGSVYEGRLQDGTQVAVKVLSAESVQGDREFMSEIASISNLKHTNLVKLHGCCIYGPCRILVYDFMQNNSLAQVLHGGEKNRAKLSWRLRTRIAEGIAKALSYIHEETLPPISVPELLEPCYIAPEYVISGRLSRNSDVYSFGVLLLEIVSGRTTIDFDVNRGEYFLVEKAWEMYKSEELIQLVDPMLNGSFYEKEAVRLMKVGLLCVQEKSGLRPHMSTVIKMMNGEINVDEIQVSRPGIITSIMDAKIGHRQSSSSSSR